MISRCLRRQAFSVVKRSIHQVPFQDDLSPVDEDLFNLGDFHNYQESPDVKAHRKKLGLDENGADNRPRKDSSAEARQQESVLEAFQSTKFQQACELSEPVVFVSRILNPYVNLAIEDYVYHHMPLPKENNCNRLMFYINSPCVVIGKNQNPWKEVNLPLLNNLRIPLVRRRSGGGTVVHDSGNVNYSFMTTKDAFDRKSFAEVVVDSVNSIAPPEKKITVNDRGDIITQHGSFKVSGSAYKLSKGRSYHHGTMLLNLRLDVLRQLLHRDEEKLGYVTSEMSIASVKSPVTNLEIDQDAFVEAVTDGFKKKYGTTVEKPDTDEVDEFDQTEMLGLGDFVAGFSQRECKVVYIEDTDVLPPEVETVKNELMEWEWKFGNSMKFQHKFVRGDFLVEFQVAKKGILESFHLSGADEHVTQSFEFLQAVLDRGDRITYTGSNVAGFVTDDELSEWIGEAIDGTT